MASHFRTRPLPDSTLRLGSICRRRIDAKSLRGANQVAIIAKAARLVLRFYTRPDFFAARPWRCYARCQADSFSSHRVPDPYACAQRVKARAPTVRTNYRSAGTGDTDCTSGSRSAAGLLDYRRAALARGRSRHCAARCSDRGADPARISMQLFDAGNLDRVGRRRLVVQLFSREPGRKDAVRRLPHKRECSLAIHSAGSIHSESAKADDLQWRGVHATLAGGNFGGTIVPPATIDRSGAADPMHAMRVQLNRSGAVSF